MYKKGERRANIYALKKAQYSFLKHVRMDIDLNLQCILIFNNNACYGDLMFIINPCGHRLILLQI